MKLSLEKTWTECLRMWKWIAGRWKKGDKRGVLLLKRIWMIANGYINKRDIPADCFFCYYDHLHRTRNWTCSCCPAQKIDNEFDCHNEKYSYEKNPIAFYAKLVALNKIRLKQSKGKRK